MRTQHILSVLCFLLIAILAACNLPAGKNAAQPDLPSTATAQALAFQAPGGTPSIHQLNPLTSTPAVAKTSIAVRVAKSTNGHPSPAAQAVKYTEKGGEKVAVAIKDASKATVK